jgi:gamma-glutamylcyclotransferase (GGCT)/AIG2-like uncharacterized protein YtfP
MAAMSMGTTEILNAPPERRLFVYGTLMSIAAGDYGQAARLQLRQEAPHRVGAHTFGQLFELGRYPGMVTSTVSDDVVHGEVLLLTQPQSTLAWLDEYEAISTAPDANNEYVRQTIRVTVPGGMTIGAWAYIYTKPVQGLVRLASGRWRSGTRRSQTIHSQ